MKLGVRTCKEGKSGGFVGKKYSDEEKLALLPKIVKISVGNEGGAVLIYCGTRAGVEAAAQALQTRGSKDPNWNFEVGMYHAGMDDSAREAAQDAFMSGATPVMVRTAILNKQLETY